MSYFRTIANSSFHRSAIRQISRRYFLSNAFDCNDTWNSRLNHQVFKKVNIENMYYELDTQYNKTNVIAPIDVDIFVNAQTDDSYLTEVEELLYRFRLTRLAHRTLPTTHHAFIRLFFDYKKEDLVRILQDRLNYGIFPDDYLICYLINKFLKTKDYRNAAKVACLQMFQEDYSHTLSRNLSLYAIHRYLLTEVPWEDVIEEQKEGDDDDEEEIKVRVPYLRNPYFDDHFDLKDGQHICGKSLIMISKHLDDIALRNSFKIFGLALYNKWEKLESELKNTIQLQKDSKDPVLYKNAYDLTSKIITEKLTDESSLNKIQSLFGQIEPEKCLKDDLLEDVENLVKETVKVSEADHIASQNELYKEWEILREEELTAHLQELQRKNRLEEVARKKAELLEREQLLYFFDNEDEINAVCAKKEELLRKRAKYQSAEKLEEEYVPPEVQKRVID